MRDWLDSAMPGYPLHREAEYWCQRCREPFVATERFDNESGGYDSESVCPYCAREGVPREEVMEHGPEGPGE